MKGWFYAVLLGTAVVPCASSQPSSSADGHYRCSLDQQSWQQLRTTRDGRPAWKRELPGFADKVLAVSSDGKALLSGTQGTENRPGAFVVDARAALFVPLHDLRAGWFSNDGSKVFLVPNSGRLRCYHTGGGYQCAETDLIAELKNPAAPKEELLAHVGQVASWRQLRELKIDKVYRLANLAAGGDRPALARLLSMRPAGEQARARWLEALRIAGPSALKNGLRATLEEWPHPVAWSAATREPETVQAWSKEWLCNSPGERFTLAILEVLPATLRPDLVLALEMRALEDAAVAEAVVSKLQSAPEPNHATLARLLRAGRATDALLSHFTQYHYEPVLPVLIDALANSSEHEAAAHAALVFQTRMDLGTAPGVWRDWMTLPGQARCSWRAKHTFAHGTPALLLAAAMGKLNANQLSGRFRVVQVVRGFATLTPDGSRLVDAENPGATWPLLDQEIEPVPVADSEQTEASGQFLDAGRRTPDGRYLLTLSYGRMQLRRLPGSQVAKELFFPFLPWLQERRISMVWRGGRRLVGLPNSAESTWVVDASEHACTLPPPEHQGLFAELWTGHRYKSGLAWPLEPEEYRARRRRWLELTRTDWTVSPQWSQNSGVAWQHMLLLAFVGWLVIVRVSRTIT